MPVKQILRRPFFFPVLFFGLSVFLVLIAWTIRFRAESGKANAISRAEKNLQRLENKMTASLQEISALTTDSAFHDYFIHKGFQKSGFSFFYFEDNKITRWSDNETQVNNRAVDTCKSHTLIHLNNGWYEIFMKEEDGKKIIGLILIRKEYAYENQYLVNSFNPLLNLPENVALTTTNDPNSSIVHSANGTSLFELRWTNSTLESSNAGIKIYLFMLALIFILIASFLTAKTISKTSPLISGAIMVLLVAARIAMIHFQVPYEFYASEFFSPQLYASSFYFNSPGDLFINSLIILCVAGIFYVSFSGKAVRRQSLTGSMLVKTGVLVLIFFIFIPLNSLISGLILNSKISFDVSAVFELNEYSVLSFFVMAVLLSSYFLFTFSLLRIFFHEGARNFFSKWLLFPAAIILAICFLFVSKERFQGEWLLLILFSASLVCTGMLNINKKIRSNFLMYITLFFSIYSSVVIRNLNDDKEKENRKLLAQKIETGKDQVAEYLFEDVRQKINNDAVLVRYLKDSLHVQEQISRRLMQIYFTGYWRKYDITVYCFDQNGLSFDSLRANLSADSLLRGIKEVKGDDPQLYYISKESEPQQYVAHMPVYSGNYLAGSIVVVFVPKLFQSGSGGFQELFVGSKVAFNKELNKYSVARYQNDSLFSQSGKFAYYFSLKPFRPSAQEYSFINMDDYNHLVFRINPSSYIIVSRNKENVLIFFTLFSYLFSFFSVLLFLFYVLVRVLNREATHHLSLTRRIQVSVMLLVILSFVIIGASTMYYITHKYDNDKDESISEKINPLLPVIERELGDNAALTGRLNDDIRVTFIRLSGSRDAQFNLFTADGDLFYSSQPKIFERGIISEKMNPEALFEISEGGKTQFVHEESIGKLTYTAAYEPFRNKQGKVLGYLHLPYFEKQNELNKEISGFLSSLINIYILLLALAVIVTLFISSRITQPLLLIQDKLSSIRLGRKNEWIEYRQKDEIGELVNEYNRMVDELSVSADKLARSERESAWREMAKQVAHEIKNPLTPMKLSVQHLQKAWEEKSPQLDEIFKRIAGTLIEQIDALSKIATEFSTFAQMPPPKKEQVDLNAILKSTIDLFKELPGISILFDGDKTEKLVVADKDQLIRLFSNLLKNASQAIATGRQGVINVSVSSSEDNFVISIKDNGAGIPLQQQRKIFTPSFTTKSGGMGLGLSIAKSIVESSGGTIRFETEEGMGTTFFISLPRLRGKIV